MEATGPQEDAGDVPPERGFFTGEPAPLTTDSPRTQRP
jgi:hypothetical protein